MALNSSGPISLAGTTTGQSIEVELGGTGTTQISLNDASVRTLAGVPSGAIIMPTNFWGKANSVSGWYLSDRTYKTSAIVANTSMVVCETSNGSGFQTLNLTTGALSSNTYYAEIDARSNYIAQASYYDTIYGRVITWEGSNGVSPCSVIDPSSYYTSYNGTFYGTPSTTTAIALSQTVGNSLYTFGDSPYNSGSRIAFAKFTYANGATTNNSGGEYYDTNFSSPSPQSFAVTPDQTNAVFIWYDNNNVRIGAIPTSTGTMAALYTISSVYPGGARQIVTSVTATNSAFYWAENRGTSLVVYKNGSLTTRSFQWGKSINLPTNISGSISTNNYRMIQIYVDTASSSVLVAMYTRNSSTGLTEIFVACFDESTGAYKFGYRVYDAAASSGVGQPFVYGSQQQFTAPVQSSTLAFFQGNGNSAFGNTPCIYAFPFANKLADGTYTWVGIANYTTTASSQTTPTTYTASVTRAAFTAQAVYASNVTALTNVASTTVQRYVVTGA
jgi:hypothetical protein